MKRFSFPVLLLVFFAVGCAHGPAPGLPLSSPPFSPGVWRFSVQRRSRSKSPRCRIRRNRRDRKNLKKAEAETKRFDLRSARILESTPEMSVKSGTESADEENRGRTGGERDATIADPLEPFNRAMYHFNDKLYFWVLKPVAQGYNKVVPEAARVGVKNFFLQPPLPDPFRQLPAPGGLRGCGHGARPFRRKHHLGYRGVIGSCLE